MQSKIWAVIALTMFIGCQSILSDVVVGIYGEFQKICFLLIVLLILDHETGLLEEPQSFSLLATGGLLLAGTLFGRRPRGRSFMDFNTKNEMNQFAKRDLKVKMDGDDVVAIATKDKDMQGWGWIDSARNNTINTVWYPGKPKKFNSREFCSELTRYSTRRVQRNDVPRVCWRK